MAQTTKIPLPMKQPEESDALVQFHSTSEALNIFPHQPFIANPKSLSEVQGYFTPNFTGKRLALITAINVNSRILLNSWIIHANVGIPNIVKTYEISLPLGNAEDTKKDIVEFLDYSCKCWNPKHCQNLRNQFTTWKCRRYQKEDNNRKPIFNSTKLPCSYIKFIRRHRGKGISLIETA
uniref:Uncharacterized protein n=1 Tax=Panagrolaimus sp. JU765 TaxID=591449 RepID=A0AC34QBE0_9BILA